MSAVAFAVAKWCAGNAAAHDGPGYPWRARMYDRIGGASYRLAYWLHFGRMP